MTEARADARAGELSDALASDLKQRLEEEKTIVLRMVPGQRPDVTFTGFWTGKFVQAAQNSISKAYRLRRFKPQRLPNTGSTKPLTQEVKVEGGKGDVPVS